MFNACHNRRCPRGLATACAALLTACLLTLTPLVANAQDMRTTRTVRTGDTLSAIAEAYGLTVQELVWLNGIDDPDLIFPGEVLALTADASNPSDTSTVSLASDVTAGDSADGGSAAASSDGVAAVDASSALPPWVDRQTIREDLAAAADKWGWDPYLIMALAWQESGWQQDALSNVGAIGVMQLMPDTAAQLDAWLFQRGADPWNSVWDNIESGVAFLTVLYQETGDVELAIGSYYQGLGSVERDGFFPETHAYVDNIISMRDLFAAGTLP